LSLPKTGYILKPISPSLTRWFLTVWLFYNIFVL